jgi:phage terminase large subunit-like protein
MDDIARQLLEIQQELDNRTKYNYLQVVFPDNDIPDDRETSGAIFSRTKYPKHIDFLNAGGKYRQRAFIAANRVGKSFAGCYELACHLTGWYPDWWEGKRFDRPIKAWMCGDRLEVIRDGMQKCLLERQTVYPNILGTGLLPKDNIISVKNGSNIAGAFTMYEVKHVSGGTSLLSTKTYSSGREAFESAAIDVIMLDEKCPMDIYSECMLRTMTNNGIVYLTFTPTQGITDTVLSFFDNGEWGNKAANGRFVTNVTWEDVPHLTEQMKLEMIRLMPKHEIDCRTKGIPYLGAGAIYPYSVDEITCEPFKIPEHYWISYGLDVGWNNTTCIWGAIDPDSKVSYIFAEYYGFKAEPSVHAHNIRSKGEWIAGVVDPAARGRSQVDGKQLLSMYTDLGLDLIKADNSVESGIYICQQALASGMCKIFTTCHGLLRELKLYRRQENGTIVKKDDHGLDAWRYYMVSGRDIACPLPTYETEAITSKRPVNSDICGY